MSVTIETLSKTSYAPGLTMYLIAIDFQPIHIPDFLLDRRIESNYSSRGKNNGKRHLRVGQSTEMAFLNNRVTPEPVPPSTLEGETELSDSLGPEKDKDSLNNNDERDSSIIIDHGGANECPEGLDGIPEDDAINRSTTLLQNGKRSPSTNSRKFVSWNPEENISTRRNHACDRVLLLAMCFMSAAALMLTLLMLFGVVGPLQCACSGEKGIYYCFLSQVLLYIGLYSVDYYILP